MDKNKKKEYNHRYYIKHMEYYSEKKPCEHCGQMITKIHMTRHQNTAKCKRCQ